MAALWFVTGGARSGKSAFAERLASHAAGDGGRVVYIATLQPLDQEMRDRIARHQADRPAAWETVEAPRDPAGALTAADPQAVVLLDCISLWVSNLLLASGAEDLWPHEVAALEAQLDVEADAIAASATGRAGLVILVTNEVGSGVVPPYPLGRIYRDVLGRVNQRLSRQADRAWLVVAGRPLELPSPDVLDLA